MAKIELADRAFKSKELAEQYIRGILDGAMLNQPLNSSAAGRVVSWLAQVHDDFDNKRGPGIKSVTVRQNFSNARGFWLVRIDGSETDVTYKPYRNMKLKKKAAFRWAVMHQGNGFRASIGDWPIQCPICNMLVDSDGGHVDHIYPDTFSKILDDFLKLHGIDFQQVRIRSAIGDPIKKLVDIDLRDCWREYHQDRAVYRILCADCNTRIGNRELLIEGV